ncbi:MAG: hypothetical protein Q9162_003011 [Coniocarpon cinnabarinum]
MRPQALQIRHLLLRKPDPSFGYANTSVPDDPTWSLVSTAEFVLFDQPRGLEVLGDSPRLYPNQFQVLPVIHEAPIYVPSLNKLFVTQSGPPGNLSNLVIDLNEENPTPRAFTTDPPVYQPSGGVLHENMIYWAVQGNNDSLPGGLVQRPGIVRVDPATYKAEWLCNNYYGFFFGGLSDLTVGPDGDIWFTDSGTVHASNEPVIRSLTADSLILDYAYGLKLAPAANQLALATYRFRPSTGEVSIADNTLQHPHGITFSRDGKTLYIADSGLETVGSVSSTDGFYHYPISINFTSTNNRNIFAFDVTHTETGAYISNKRNIYQSLEGAPDGLEVAANGYLIVASGSTNGVDILTATGQQIARIQTTHPVEDIAFAGPDSKTMYLSGIGGISRVDWGLAGPDPNSYYA